MTPALLQQNHRSAAATSSQNTFTPTATPICLITHEFYPKHGGIATYSEEIARAAASLGYRIEVWAQAATKEKAWPFPVKRLPVKGTHNVTCRTKLTLELIRQRRYLRNAIVYMPEPAPLLAMMPLQFISGFRPKRLILTFHGSEILRFYNNPAHRVLMGSLINKADRISTLTEYTRRLLCDYFPAAQNKTILAPGALRTDLAAHGGGSNGTIAPFAPNHYSLPHAQTSKRVVLTVGRIHPRKGQIYTLRALMDLPAALRQNTEYWIAGKLTGNEYEKQLRETATEAARLGLVVRFLGEVPDRKLSEAYARADIFAMTSINYRHSIEGFGLVYLEASAHGLPVVAHRVGGVSEAVLDGVTGFVIPPINGSSYSNPPLTEAFEKLLSDPALRRRMGNAGRAHAQRNSWHDSAKKLFAPAEAYSKNGVYFSTLHGSHNNAFDLV